VSKVALITSGGKHPSSEFKIFLKTTASGLGLAVAKSLSAKGWLISIADMNESTGQKAASSLPGSIFHQSNVTSYTSLSSTFQKAFDQFGHIAFFFANAGIVERDSFYTKFPSSGPPPEPDMLSIDIDLKAVVATGYLA
jgi:NAD(P)-dependent dehydrogenase (short-subunit alcohol dehydrogenase family)